MQFNRCFPCIFHGSSSLLTHVTVIYKKWQIIGKLLVCNMNTGFVTYTTFNIIALGTLLAKVHVLLTHVTIKITQTFWQIIVKSTYKSVSNNWLIKWTVTGFVTFTSFKIITLGTFLPKCMSCWHISNGWLGQFRVDPCHFGPVSIHYLHSTHRHITRHSFAYDLELICFMKSCQKENITR